MQLLPSYEVNIESCKALGEITLDGLKILDIYHIAMPYVYIIQLLPSYEVVNSKMVVFPKALARGNIIS